MCPPSHPSVRIPSLTISLTLNPVAIIIPLIVAGMVKVCAVSPHRTFQNMVPRYRRRLNAPVDSVALSGNLHLVAVATFACVSILTMLAYDTGVPVPQMNHGWEGAQARRPQVHHHLHPMHSVASLRDPPPAYPAHHLDAPFDGVVRGYDNVSNTGGAVDVLPVTLPPSYDRTSADGSDQSV